MSVDAATALLSWYDVHARRLPWRSPPGTPAPDPYRVWLSEVMLQQTTVATVKAAYLRFTERWPNVAALAATDDAALMAAWAGLGYYARARNLIACARAVMAEHGGRLPDSEAALRRLPGIGDYTAAAIAAIAFGRRAVVVDANVERVVARLARIETPLPAGRGAIRAATDAITPATRAGDFAQAMMDLGATICTPRDPACALCPVRELCEGYRAGDPGRLPVKAAKRPKPDRYGAICWITQGADVLLVRRPARGLLGGMRALPTGPWGDEPMPVPDIAGDWTRVPGGVVHGFTHFRLTLTIFRAEAEQVTGTLPDGSWWPIARIEDAGLPTLFAKAARHALETCR